jgi:hypothetical protein
MRTVRDETGQHYLLLKRSEDSSLVRDPTTGQRRYVATDRLEAVDGEPPLETAARAVPAAVRTLFTAVHDERALGLLCELHDREALGVRTLLGETDLCESDLHGMLAELQAGGLVEETTVAGERGYTTTDTAAAAVATLRE